MVQCLVDGMLQNITRLTRISLNQPPSPHQFDELMIGNRKVFGAVAAYHDDGHEEKVDGCDPMRQGGSQPVALGVVLVAGASNLPRRRQVCVPLHPPAPVSPSNPAPVAGGGKPESRSVRSIPCYPSSPDPSMPIFICPAPSPTTFPPPSRPRPKTMCACPSIDWAAYPRLMAQRSCAHIVCSPPFSLPSAVLVASWLIVHVRAALAFPPLPRTSHLPSSKTVPFYPSLPAPLVRSAYRKRAAHKRGEHVRGGVQRFLHPRVRQVVRAEVQLRHPVPGAGGSQVSSRTPPALSRTHVWPCLAPSALRWLW